MVPRNRTTGNAMTINTIEAERLLVDEFRKGARERLGPDATDAEIEAKALQLYEGPPPRDDIEETDEQRQRREENTQMARENYRRWNL